MANDSTKQNLENKIGPHEYYTKGQWYYNQSKLYPEIGKFVGFNSPCYKCNSYEGESKYSESFHCPGQLVFESMIPQCSNLWNGTLDKLSWVKVPSEYLWAADFIEQTHELRQR